MLHHLFLKIIILADVEMFSDVRCEDRREDRGLEVEAGDDKGGLGAVDITISRERTSQDLLYALLPRQAVDAVNDFTDWIPRYE